MIHITFHRNAIWRVAPVSTPQKPHRGRPGPSLLGTGETPDLNWQEEAHGHPERVPARRDESKDLHLSFVLYQGMSLLMPQTARPSFK